MTMTRKREVVRSYAALGIKHPFFPGEWTLNRFLDRRAERLLREMASRRKATEGMRS